MSTAHGIPDGALSARNALALLAGALGCFLLPTLPWWPLLAALVAAGTGWWCRGRRLRWLGAVLAGFGWAGLQAMWMLSAQLPPAWEKRDLLIEGRIAELPTAEPRRTRFRLVVDDRAAMPEPLRGRSVQLS